MPEDKTETTEELVEKKVKKRLSPYEWRVLRKKMALRSRLTAFQREFRKQMATFITGAFAFVAALLWRDVIKSFLETYEVQLVALLPFKEGWVVQFISALAVSVVAIAAIMVVSRTLKR